MASQSPPSDAELLRCVDQPAICVGLDHWSLWTLLCLHRHLDRQKWVGYVIESRLNGDLQRLGNAGTFGRPKDSPQSGKVPDEPDWSFFFHGCGCCLTNDVTGVCIDVDFTQEGESNRIDRFFYSNFLSSLERPEFPESVIRRPEPLEHAWQVEIDRLRQVNCLEAGPGTKLTSFGVSLAEALEPLSKEIGRLLEWGTSAALRNTAYAALRLGDVILANQIVLQTDASTELKARIFQECDHVDRARLLSLKNALTGKLLSPQSYLAAIADLGPQLAEESVTSSLFRNPVDGAANTALEILRIWNRPDLADVLKRLLNQRIKEAFGFASILGKLIPRAQNSNDNLPRNYQATHAAIALFQRVRPDSLDTTFKGKLQLLLENTGGAHGGVGALLIYLLNKERGLQCLRGALSGKVPAGQQDAAAACVVIGTQEAKQILEEALGNPDERVQHTVACALASFPTEDARNFARRWFARNDGIQDPLGKEVTMFGSTHSVYTFDEVSHVNMDMFFVSSLEKLRKDFSPLL